ncbi:unnamed protein product [Fraxinus pennsylvanica]|uniref:Uncharacterized protein n=1 Tax=Fraxinus pennsylvanica TaxID=56036 RepID=A0AAD1Z614_9LAMI|nr:unnamed protein product [Fraxinus pennsylvanica]
MKNDLDMDVAGRNICLNNQRLIMHRDTSDKIYLPSIPWPARTGNFPSPMPWVMKRFNGRLVLNLIPFDDDVLEEHAEDEVVVVDDDDQTMKLPDMIRKQKKI